MSDLQKELSFLKNKKILITGNTGFKGSWLTYIISNVTKNIYGISLREKVNSTMYYNVGINNLIKKQLNLLNLIIFFIWQPNPLFINLIKKL